MRNDMSDERKDVWRKNCNDINDIPISMYGLQVNEERIPNQSPFYFSIGSR